MTYQFTINQAVISGEQKPFALSTQVPKFLRYLATALAVSAAIGILLFSSRPAAAGSSVPLYRHSSSTSANNDLCWYDSNSQTETGYPVTPVLLGYVYPASASPGAGWVTLSLWYNPTSGVGELETGSNSGDTGSTNEGVIAWIATSSSSGSGLQQVMDYMNLQYWAGIAPIDLTHAKLPFIYDPSAPLGYLPQTAF